MQVLSVTPSNIEAFDKIIEKAPAFVKIYHPSCGHCIAMKGAWDKLAQSSKNLPHEAAIVEIHADTLQDAGFSKKYPELVSKVHGYPNLMIIEKGGRPGKEYQGDRSYEDMKKFCEQNLFRKKHKGGKSKKVKRGKGKSKKVKRGKGKSKKSFFNIFN